MTKVVVKKVVAFVLHGDEIAVFEQDDADSGLQVPAGTLRAGEDPEAGALREATEETGIAGLRVVGFLGRYRWDISPIREEIQDRFVYQLTAPPGQPREWVSHEMHDGARPPTTLRFSWRPLGHPELAGLAVGQGTLLDRVRRPGKPGRPETAR